MELALGVLWTKEFVAIVRGSAVSARRTAGLEVALGVVTLGHNDNIIQIKLIQATSSIFLIINLSISYPTLILAS